MFECNSVVGTRHKSWFTVRPSAPILQTRQIWKSSRIYSHKQAADSENTATKLFIINYHERSWKLTHYVSYSLCYLAVGCCNKTSCVVYITPDHIVRKVGFQHQELGIDLELRDEGQKEQFDSQESSLHFNKQLTGPKQMLMKQPPKYCKQKKKKKKLTTRMHESFCFKSDRLFFLLHFGFSSNFMTLLLFETQQNNTFHIFLVLTVLDLLILNQHKSNSSFSRKYGNTFFHFQMPVMKNMRAAFAFQSFGSVMHCFWVQQWKKNSPRYNYKHCNYFCTFII